MTEKRKSEYDPRAAEALARRLDFPPEQLPLLLRKKCTSVLQRVLQQ